MDRTQRIRDPIHDLIVFEKDNPVDEIAWEILRTPEFQRLRRVKQLGVSEFVYPGATHSRFAHSIGVYHNARRLIQLINREIRTGRLAREIDEPRAKIAQLAALVHDIGHGPFSHAFEEARKAILGMRSKSDQAKPKFQKHEYWTAEIVENPKGNIAPILESRIGAEAAKVIGTLLRSETPTDMYHAIVSSSFDADRLDYIQRDRYMTGTGVGAIDFRWLLDNVRVFAIDISPATDESADPVRTLTFCLDRKGREAAEDFLLARFRLYSNVYLHKTTRGIEQLLTALFKGIAISTEDGSVDKLGLSSDHPLVRFFSPGGESLETYCVLDDGVVWGALERIAMGRDGRLASIATRILTRHKPAALDVEALFPGHTERQRRAQHYLDELLKKELGDTVFKDEATLTLYGPVGADDDQAHKRLMILLSEDDPREITEVPDVTIRNVRRRLLRYYFLDEARRNNVQEEICSKIGGSR